MVCTVADGWFEQVDTALNPGYPSNGYRDRVMDLRDRWNRRVPSVSQPIEAPTEPGWYIARMKTWAIDKGYAPVLVTARNGNITDGLQVWQCADERSWQVEVWDWRARIWP